ncbi:MAG: hypothetical protein MJZ37_10545 [Bacilli bacterium]|nr:hypothetical protein [Bacilli bacterium]
MTNKEAIKAFKGNCFGCCVKGKHCENCKTHMAIEALEKQILKKPKRVDHWALCPTCYSKYGFSYDTLVGMRGLKTGECHCLNCGQAILWEE